MNNFSDSDSAGKNDMELVEIDEKLRVLNNVQEIFVKSLEKVFELGKIPPWDDMYANNISKFKQPKDHSKSKRTKKEAKMSNKSPRVENFNFDQIDREKFRAKSFKMIRDMIDESVKNLENFDNVKVNSRPISFNTHLFQVLNLKLKLFGQLQFSLNYDSNQDIEYDFCFEFEKNGFKYKRYIKF